MFLSRLAELPHYLIRRPLTHPLSPSVPSPPPPLRPERVVAGMGGGGRGEGGTDMGLHAAATEDRHSRAGTDMFISLTAVIIAQYKASKH